MFTHPPAPPCARSRAALTACAAAVAFVCCAQPARGLGIPTGTATYIGAGADENFNNSANWVPGIPADNWAVLIGVANRQRLNINLPDIDLHSITFQPDAPLFVVEGFPLGITHSITNLSGHVQTFDLTLEAAGSLNFEGVNGITVSNFTNTGANFSLRNNLTSSNLFLQNTQIAAGPGPFTFTLQGVGSTIMSSPHAPGASDVLLSFRSRGPTIVRGTGAYDGNTEFGGKPEIAAPGAYINYSGGKVTVDFDDPSSPITNILNNNVNARNALLAGMDVAFLGAFAENNSQTFDDLTVGPGFGEVSLIPGAGGGNMNLHLDLITRDTVINRGLINFNVPANTAVFTNTLNLPAANGGLLNAGARVVLNRNAFAMNNTNAPGGSLVPITGVPNNAGFTGLSQYANVDLTVNANITTTIAVGTIRIFNPLATSINIIAGQAGYLYNGSFLYAESAGPGGASVNGGFFIGRDGLRIFNFNTQGALNLNTVIANYTDVATPLEIVGIPGAVTVLSGNNIHTGETNLSNSTIRVFNNFNLGMPSANRPVNLDNAVLEVMDNLLLYNNGGARTLTISRRGARFNIAGGKAMVIRGPVYAEGASITKGLTGLLVFAGPGIPAFVEVNNLEGGIQIGEGGLNGDLGDAHIINNANLAFYRSDAFVSNNWITGSGNVTNFSAAPLILAGPTNLTGDIIINDGPIQFRGPSHFIGNVSGDGSWVVESGASVHSGWARVNVMMCDGNVRLLKDRDASLSNTLQFNEGALLAAESAALGPPAPAYLGQLDITNNIFVLQASNPADKTAKIAQLTNYLNAGNNNNTWTGRGVTSSTAALDPAHYGVSLFDNALLVKTAFDAVAIDSNSLILSVAHIGDTNLDGIVDINDLGNLANSWQQSGTTSSRGDFNRDGFVDINDLGILANHWQHIGSFPAELAGMQASAANVPEPASLAILAVAGAALALKPRRRR